MFGLTRIWLSKEHPVQVSDIERTIIDGLRQPAYVGGITEVAKGLWMKRDDISVETLIGYAKRLDIGAVIRRWAICWSFINSRPPPFWKRCEIRFPRPTSGSILYWPQKARISLAGACN